MADGTRTHDSRDHNPGLYQLSYGHHRKLFMQNGAPGRSRTCDHRLRRPVLYPTELRAHSRMGDYLTRAWTSSVGRGSRIRTCDPLLPKQMRYQTALLPDDRFGPRFARILMLGNPPDYLCVRMVGPAGFEPTT